MIKILIIAFLIAIIYSMRNIKIKWNTFFRRGFAPKRGKFGVYCYCGKQGQGKTYSAIEFLLANNDKPIYSNLTSINGINYTYYSGLEGLLKLRDKTDCIIFHDEIFTALTKSSRMTTDILDFLSQMRKRRIIFITTAQEWLELNITLRRYCRYQIDCHIINFLGLGILIKDMYDAEQMHWSTADNEYIAPLVEKTVSKCNLRVANKYDTFEQIKNN